MIDISIVIPVFKEKASILKTIERINSHLKFPDRAEIIIADHQKSSEIASGSFLHVNSPEKGRAKQMNFGARHAKGRVLYFLHADSQPPKYFDEFIYSTLKNGFLAGSFLMQFDKDHFFLRFFAWFTRFKNVLCSGGDQSLFVEKGLFEKINGFDEDHEIMEDLDIVKRLRKRTNYKVIKDAKLVTSSRKYEANGIYRLQFLFGILHLKYFLGFSQSCMMRFYKRHIITPRS